MRYPALTITTERLSKVATETGKIWTEELDLGVKLAELQRSGWGRRIRNKQQTTTKSTNTKEKETKTLPTKRPQQHLSDGPGQLAKNKLSKRRKYNKTNDGPDSWYDQETPLRE